MDVIYFSDELEFRKWLDKNHNEEKELLIGFYKVGSGKPSMTWSQSVDQAICYGWIDGIRRSVDAERYTIRFTPRKRTSIWSDINIKKVEDLTAKGLMKPAGIEIFKLRRDSHSGIYSHEKAEEKLSAEFEKKFKANKKAWEFSQSQAPSYKKVLYHHIMTARQEKTRISRLEKLISKSEKGLRVL